jgi:hypothetical protein
MELASYLVGIVAVRAGTLVLGLFLLRRYVIHGSGFGPTMCSVVLIWPRVSISVVVESFEEQGLLYSFLISAHQPININPLH